MLSSKRLVLLILLFMSSAFFYAQRDDTLLQEYQKIAKENEAYRFIPFEGTPPARIRAVKDKAGYTWLHNMISLNENEILRFNGTVFEDMFATYLSTERDSLIGLLTQPDSTIVVIGRHHIYLWQGFGFRSFAFDQKDRVESIFVQHDMIVCVGNYGYAILKGHEFTYLPTNTLISFLPIFWLTWKSQGQILPYYRHWLDERGNLCQLKQDFVFSENFNLESIELQDDLYIYRYSKSQKDSILVIGEDEIKEFNKNGHSLIPAVFVDSSNQSWLYFPNTNLLYHIDTDNKIAIAHHIKADQKIIAVRKLSGNISWLIYTEKNKLSMTPLGDVKQRGVSIISLDLESAIHWEKQNILIIDKDKHHIINSIKEDLYQKSIGGFIYDLFYYFKDFNDGNTLTRVFTLDLASKTLREHIIPHLNDVKPSSVLIQNSQKSYPIPTVFGENIVWSQIHPIYPSTHLLYVYDSRSKELIQRALIAEASKINVLAYDNNAKLLLVSTQKGVFRLKLSKTMQQVADFKWDTSRDWFYFFPDGNRLLLLGNRNDQYWETLGTELFSLENDKLKHEKSIKGMIDVGRDKNNRLLYLKKEGTGGSTLYKYDLKTGELSMLKQYPETYRFQVRKDELFAYSSSNCEVWTGDKATAPKHRWQFKALNNMLSPLLKQYDINIDDILDYNNGMFERNLVFFPENWFALEKRGTSFIPKSMFIGDKLSSRAQKAGLTKGNPPVLKIPSMIYDLAKDKLYLKPDWISVDVLDTDTYITHIEKHEKQYRLRISKYRMGKLIKAKEDFVYRIKGDAIPQLRLFWDKADIFPVISDTLYYQADNSWKKFDLKGFGKYGYLVDICKLDAILWIRYNYAILKFDSKRQLMFEYSPKDGLPTEISGMYIDDQGRVYVIGDGSLMRLNESSEQLKLDIPWIEVGDSQYDPSTSLKLNYKNNSLRFYLNILNQLYPERCQVEYRLFGFDDKWKTRAYSKFIEYEKLPEGKYVFEIRAYSPEGYFTDVQSFSFRIIPPWYRTWWAYILYLAIFLFLLRAFFVYRTRRLKRENLFLEKQVAQRTKELEDSTLELKERQQKIQEAIEYASLIQRSILPQESDLKAAFADYFILWKPKDKVGGDFYWYYSVPDSDEQLFAVIDCTGHSVPGAMLSMTVYALLNNIAKDLAEHSPAQILKNTHRDLGSALHQESEKTQQDGMDIALVQINRKTKQIVFSGAGLHMICFEEGNDELKFIKGNKYGVGGLKWHKDLDYEEQSFAYQPGMKIVLYTDGYIDQPQAEGEKRRRFGTQNWLQLLSETKNQSLFAQHQIIQSKLEEMLSYHEQRDDITVVGIEL